MSQAMESAEDDEFTALWALAARMLDEGVTNRQHGFHLMQAACVNAEDGPEVRTVVLRRHDVAEKMLAFHTDIRSPKVRWLQRKPAVSLLLYDRQSKTQLRFYAQAVIHAQDAVAAYHWANTRDFSKVCYLATQGSGVPVGHASACGVSGHAVRVESDAQDAVAYSHFAVIACHYHRLDMVQLRAHGHQRACIQWDKSGGLQGCWVAV